MAKADQQVAFERLQTATLVRVIDFLKFGEAKNAALLAFASAWIIGSINILNGVNSLSLAWKMAFLVALLLFSISALLSIFSFLPQIALNKFYREKETTKSLIFFGDIASLEPLEFKELFINRYYPLEGNSATENYIDDQSVQISVISQIIIRKMKFFNVSALCIILAIFVLLIPALVEFWSFIVSLR